MKRPLIAGLLLMLTTYAASLLPVALLLLAGNEAAAQEPDWNQVRAAHPRLYFNADTWPGVKAQAEGPLATHFAEVRKVADSTRPPADREMSPFWQ